MLRQKKLPMIYQNEHSECGLACTLMIASYHGYKMDITTFRNKYQIPSTGAKLDNIISILHSVGLDTRALKVELEDLHHISCPAILHWDLKHFVVLKRIKNNFAFIHDPASGIKKMKLSEVSKHFTGVALEVIKTIDFNEENEENKLKIKSFINQIPEVKKSLFKIFLIASCIQIVTLLVPLYGQFVIDKILPSKDMNLLQLITLLFIGLLLFQVIFTVIRNFFVIVFSSRFKFTLTQGLFSHLFKLPLSYFEKRHIGDIISRFKSLDSIKHIVTISFIEALIDGVLSIALIILMFMYSPALTLISISLALLYYIVRLIFLKNQMQLNEENIQKNAIQSTNFIEKVRAIQTIKLFTKEDTVRKTWEKDYVESLNAEIKVNNIDALLGQVNVFLFSLTSIVILYFSVSLFQQGIVTIGMIFVFIAYNNLFLTRVGELINKIMTFKMLDLHLLRLSDIALAKVEKKSRNTIIPEYEKIEIKNLSFRYSDYDPYIFQNLNFTINKGESIAITGSSGCGKTTLLKIILGLLTPTKGMVYIDGQPMINFDLNILRQKFATVMQEDNLLSGTISENISFFSSFPSKSDVEFFSKVSCIHSDIQLLPMGYDTMIGDIGDLLSGGQKQRILLARALYHKPKFLFLDESSSNLDINLEKNINKNLRELDITKVMIAHRTETINSADRVFHFEGGELHERF